MQDLFSFDNFLLFFFTKRNEHNPQQFLEVALSDPLNSVYDRNVKIVIPRLKCLEYTSKEVYVAT